MNILTNNSENVKQETIEIPTEWITKLSAGTFQMVCLLCKYAKKDNNGKKAFPSRMSLANDLEKSVGQIDRYKKEMKEKIGIDWFYELGRKHWHNVYRGIPEQKPQKLAYMLETRLNAAPLKHGGFHSPLALLATGGRSTPKKLTKKEKNKILLEEKKQELLQLPRFREFFQQDLNDDEVTLNHLNQIEWDYIGWIKIYETNEKPLPTS